MLVTNGVYRTGSRETNGLSRVVLPSTLTLRSVNGPEVTVIEGAPAPGGGNGNGAIRCAYVGINAVLSGFTLTNGHTRVSEDEWGVPRPGGGVACDPSGLLTNCVLTGNSTEHDGGGASGSTLDNCTLTANSAQYGGGASGGTLNNCTLTGNSAGIGGGASECALNNCTLTGNSAWSGGGGAFGGTLNNCILYYNTSSWGANYIDSTFAYSCTTPLPQGLGNINADPRFVNAAAGDFRLRPDSPCIDAGTNLVDLITTDIEGHPRPLDGNGDGVARFDMGAYEFDPGVPFITGVVLTPTGLRLDWPATALGAKVQRTPNLANPLWQDVPGSEALTSITLPLANAGEFFRLVRP